MRVIEAKYNVEVPPIAPVITLGIPSHDAVSPQPSMIPTPATSSSRRVSFAEPAPTGGLSIGELVSPLDAVLSGLSGPDISESAVALTSSASASAPSPARDLKPQENPRYIYRIGNCCRFCIERLRCIVMRGMYGGGGIYLDINAFPLDTVLSSLSGLDMPESVVSLTGSASALARCVPKIRRIIL